jgi:hypothetical protein
VNQILYVPYSQIGVPPSDAFPKGEMRDYPLVKAALYVQGKVPDFDFLAVIDSGADHCLFPAIFGERAGIPGKSGKKAMAVGATGAGEVYYHNVHVGVEIQGMPYGFDCYAGFMEGLSGMGIGLLGRCGFFDLFEKVTFNTPQRLVELTLRQ